MSAFQQARRRVYPPVLLGRAAIFGEEKDDGFEGSSSAGCSCVEVDGREESKSELHTRLEEELIEEIRNFLDWVGRTMGGTHQFVCCGFSARGFDNRHWFRLGLHNGRLMGSCSFGVGLLRPGRLPGGGHFRLFVRLHDQFGRGIWFWSELADALTTCPLLRRCSNPRVGPFARWRARPAEISERQCGLWRRSFGPSRSPPLQVIPSLLSTLYSPGISPCGVPRSHRTEAVATG